MNLKNGISLFAIAIVAFTFMSCDHNRNNPGWQYFDDMVKSPAYESYTSNPNFDDGKTMQRTIEGTVPRDMIPYPYEKTDSDRVIAGQTLNNPLKATPENMAHGRELYGIYCMHCHGPEGDGQGRLYTSKKYPYPPANLLSDKMRTSPEGEIFHVITVGWGVMGEHGSMILPNDRWRIVSYIENELQKN